jgi:NADH-quinone oxidoreductase subunit L
VNRVGDLGFALGIFLSFFTFGTVSLHEMTSQAAAMQPGGAGVGWAHLAIPFLLMVGAFGKSAQLPLHVWLPDAMEGPTPVSALIHAATMVTAGVYMIARLLPVFALSPWALPTVALVGGVTALFAGTIALCQYDIKRIYAYSTISQLGYMFLGVGALSAVGGVFHLFTHAFFKALLFLTSGSVMHAMAGQLDLRKMSGLRHKMPWTCGLMGVGCLALAGFPFTAGFVSKDKILAAALGKGLGEHGSTLYLVMALLGILTALITAFYTFRLWFRVFLGPEAYEMGEEHHGEEEDSAHGGHGAHEPHEVGWLMNAPLLVLAAGSLLAGLLGAGWVSEMVGSSTAGEATAHAAGHGGGHEGHGPSVLGLSLHHFMQGLSALLAIGGIAAAGYFHWWNRPAADRVAAALRPGARLLERKYYVDELYDGCIVRPLRGLGGLLYNIDRLIIDGLVDLVGLVPRLLGSAARPGQQGRLQGYGLGMVVGAALLALLTLIAFQGMK